MTSAVEGIQRVRYVERQPLSAENLTHEQYTRLSARWRHQVSGHDWGIVFGLAAEVDDNGFTIQTGVAVDGYGRELVLQAPLAFAWGGWDEAGQPEKGNKTLFELLFPDASEETTEKADLWLLWDRQPYYPPGPGRRPVGPGQHTRWLEMPCLRVLPALVEELDPRKANEAEKTEDDPCADLTQPAGPWDNPPDDPAQEWPVFLARVIRKQRNVTPGGFEYTLDATIPRPYACLQGEAVQAVTKLARMQLSGGPGRATFSVVLPDEKGAFNDERLVIDQQNGLSAYGETQMLDDAGHKGNLTIAKRAGITARNLVNLTYLAEMLINKPNPITEKILNGIPENERGQVLQTLKEISESGRATWAQKQSVASGLAQSLAHGLPAEIIDLIQQPAGVLNLQSRQNLQSRLKLQRNLRVPVARGGRAMLLRRAAGEEAGQAEQARRLSPREALDALNAFRPGAIDQTNEGGSAGWGVAFHPLVQPPALAAPWQVYHAVVPPAPPPPGGSAGEETHQLRVELEHPGEKGDPRLFRFVIGHRRNDGSFEECLLVQADGTVVMQGASVLVKGKVLEGPVQADPADPRFGAALVQEALRGVAAATMLSATITLNTAKTKLTYSVKNNSNGSTFTCSSFFENITGKDQAIQRQGPVEGSFTLGPGETHTVAVDTTGLQGDVIVTILVVGVDQNNKLVDSKVSNPFTI